MRKKNWITGPPRGDVGRGAVCRGAACQLDAASAPAHGGLGAGAARIHTTAACQCNCCPERCICAAIRMPRAPMHAPPPAARTAAVRLPHRTVTAPEGGEPGAECTACCTHARGSGGGRTHPYSGPGRLREGAASCAGDDRGRERRLCRHQAAPCVSRACAGEPAFSWDVPAATQPGDSSCGLCACWNSGVAAGPPSFRLLQRPGSPLYASV